LDKERQGVDGRNKSGLDGTPLTTHHDARMPKLSLALRWNLRAAAGRHNLCRAVRLDRRRGAAAWRQRRKPAGVLLGTAFAIIAGTAVAPRLHWRIAMRTLIVLTLLPPLWLLMQAALAGETQPAHFIDVGYALAGSFIAYRLLRVACGGAGRTVAANSRLDEI
jgi:hypothetical protein